MLAYYMQVNGWMINSLRYMNAYIVSGYRTAVGKAGRGGFRFTRPDDLAVSVIKHLIASTRIRSKENR